MNSLWHESKSSWKTLLAQYLPIMSSITREKGKLHQKFRQLFPALEKSAKIHSIENPLNLFLPAFIGLYQVVLRGFIEVRFRSTQTDRKNYRQLFERFLLDPTGAWNRERCGITVQHIMAENLRLYPPTRRIYTQQKHGIAAVDIEQLHRLGDVWGAHPLRFDTKRWKREGLDVETTIEYIPFGGKVGKAAEISRCPSRVRGGTKLIALLIGVLLREIDESWSLLPQKEEDDVFADEPLRVGRRLYESLLLIPHAS